MEIKKRTYKELKDIGLKLGEKVKGDFPQHLILSEEAVADLFYYIDIIQLRLAEEARKKEQKLTGPKALIPLLVMKANGFLITAHETVCSGPAGPAYPMLRTVFESITKIYLLYLTEDEAQLYFKHEVDIQLTPEEKQLFEKKYQFFGEKTIRKILYTQKKRKELKRFYGEMSKFPHSSIKSAVINWEYRHDSTEDFLNLLLTMELSLFLVIAEVFNKSLSDNDHKAIETEIKKLAHHLKGIPDIIPDKEKFQGKLNINFRKRG